MIKNILTKFLYKKNYPVNYITIKRDNILFNLNYIQDLVWSDELFPVIKSNWYWHWLKEICEILRDSHIDRVCIDSYVEYQYAKKYFKKSVLVLWETNLENYKNYDFSKSSFAVYNLSTLKYLISLNKKINIHLFLNAWMNREWIQERELEEFLSELKGSNINLEWVMSHFSSADDIWTQEINSQVSKFKDLYKYLEEYWFKPKYKHISASAWILKLKDSFFNSCRPWLITYWYNPLLEKDNYFSIWEKLKPALDIYSKIISIQNINTWEWVWYSKKYISDKQGQLITIPFWYYEWLDRRMLNNYYIKYAEKFLKSAWRISMNLSSYLSQEEAKIWDEVLLISSNKSDKNSVENISKTISTISYEFLVKIDLHVSRKII